MMRFWSHGAEQSEVTAAGGEDELSMIPTWSVVLAILVFGAVQYLFHGVLPHHKHELLPMRLLMGYSWGTAFASYVLLVGYVSRDVRRAVVYFLLRQPMLMPCPHCNTEITSSVHFCPQCQFQLAPVCGRCFRGVQVTDVYCTQCGHDLAEDHAPARLRVYSD
jgi:hypothetical protein